MAEYRRGEMEIGDQVEMYDAFWKWSIRTAIGVGVILFLMYVTLS